MERRCRPCVFANSGKGKAQAAASDCLLSKILASLVIPDSNIDHGVSFATDLQENTCTCPACLSNFQNNFQIRQVVNDSHRFTIFAERPCERSARTASRACSATSGTSRRSARGSRRSGGRRSATRSSSGECARLPFFLHATCWKGTLNTPTK